MVGANECSSWPYCRVTLSVGTHYQASHQHCFQIPTTLSTHPRITLQKKHHAVWTSNESSKPMMSRYTICRVIILLLTIPFVLVISLLFRAHQQSPELTTHKFGVGFDLTPAYGTVAVAYPNGSTFSIAKIDGDGVYKEMMYRLSLHSPETTQ